MRNASVGNHTVTGGKSPGAHYDWMQLRVRLGVPGKCGNQLKQETRFVKPASILVPTPSIYKDRKWAKVPNVPTSMEITKSI